MISFWALFKWNKLTLSLHNRHMLILLQSQKLMPYYARPLVDQWLWLVPGFYIVCQLEQAKSTGFRLDECMCVTCTRFQGLHTRPGQKWKRWGPGSAAVCAKAQMSVSSGLVCMAWAGQRWIPATCKFHRVRNSCQTCKHTEKRTLWCTHAHRDLVSPTYRDKTQKRGVPEPWDMSAPARHLLKCGNWDVSFMFSKDSSWMLDKRNP